MAGGQDKVDVGAEARRLGAALELPSSRWAEEPLVSVSVRMFFRHQSVGASCLDPLQPVGLIDLPGEQVGSGVNEWGRHRWGAPGSFDLDSARLPP